MSKILISAYAINPYKGSENGSAWNFIRELARFHDIIAITRENNIPHIERYMAENPFPNQERLQFVGYDLPYYMRFWKRGGFLSLPYYFLWQKHLPAFVRRQGFECDIVHNLNFNNDWTPSFLWKLGKPFLWGPIGHHPAIPRDYIQPVYGWKDYLGHQFRWVVKNTFWKLSPALKRTIRNVDVVFPMNKSVAKEIPISGKTVQILPSVGSEYVDWEWEESKGFKVISVGRFVSLKGFDVTIRAFARFYHRLSARNQAITRLVLVGSGPTLPLLEQIAAEENVVEAVEFIAWIERSKLGELYRQSDVFFFPSHEGAGMVVAEAMSYGLPVVCFDNCGPGEFITPECGRAVPYTKYFESVTTFANHLTELYLDPDLLKSMSLAARDRFVSYFDWKRRAETIDKYYRKLLGTEDKRVKVQSTK